MRLPRDRNLIVLALLLALATAAYFTLENSHGQVGGVAELDGYYYYVYLRSVQMDRDIDFGNEYREWANPFGFDRTVTGHHRNIFGVGPALLWAPFFLLAHLLALLGAKLGYPVSLDGMSRFHQLVTFYGTLLYGWLAVVLCYRLVRDLFGREHALWPVLGAALAGPLPFYCLTWASYSHAQAAMTTTLLVWLWVRWRAAWSLRRWILFGAAAGLVILVRPACAPFLLLPLLEGTRGLLAALRARDRRLLLNTTGSTLAGAAAALLVFTPQLVVWKILYGRFFLIPQGTGFMLWAQDAWASTLFSPRNGLLTVAPLMAVALLGLLTASRKQPGLGLPLIAVFAGVLVVNGAVWDWWGWGFSARRFTASLPLFAVGLAEALRSVRERLARNPARTIAWSTAAVVLGFVVFNIQWMLSFGQRNLDWYTVRSTEGLYMTVTHSLVDHLYSTVGNPLSLPSTIPFAVRRGGSPRAFDRLDGSYLLGESNPEANPAADPYLHATLDFGDLRFRPNLSGSFGTPVRGEGTRYAPLRDVRGHVFLPVNRPGDLKLDVGGRAVFSGTRVTLVFNGQDMGTHDLPTRDWSVIPITVPARLVERGINRLDLIHHLPPPDPGPRCLGSTGRCSRVDIAAVSGGPAAGTFAEVWVGERHVTRNQRGLNVAVIDPGTGRLLGSRGFDAVTYTAEYGELAHYLRFFPRGSMVALAVRGDAARRFGPAGKEAFALFGATGQKLKSDHGYVALGVLGDAPGTALEVNAKDDHARVSLGLPPPTWREIAHYRTIRLR
jgi:hypothetical protein